MGVKSTRSHVLKRRYICWGSSRSYSPFSFNVAYRPLRERKSGIPHETPPPIYHEGPLRGLGFADAYSLMPAPVNTNMRLDEVMRLTASCRVLYWDSRSRNCSLSWRVKINSYDILTRAYSPESTTWRKYTNVADFFLCNSSH